MAITESVEVELKFTVPDHIGTYDIPDLLSARGIATLDEPQNFYLSATYYDTPDLRLTKHRATLRRRTGGNDSGWHLKTSLSVEVQRRGIVPESNSPATRRLERHIPLSETVTRSDVRSGDDGSLNHQSNPDQPNKDMRDSHTSYEPEEIPSTLLEPVRSLIRDLPLNPIAQVNNERVVYLMRDEQNRVIAEFADDHVTAWTLLPNVSTSEDTATKDTTSENATSENATSENLNSENLASENLNSENLTSENATSENLNSEEFPSRWREWEVELAPGIGASQGSYILSCLKEIILTAGVHLSASPSKLVQALGSSINSVPPNSVPPPHSVAQFHSDQTKTAIVSRIEDYRQRIVTLDPQIREDADDAVHQMRIASRELRAYLGSLDAVMEGSILKPIIKSLKRFAAILGEVRNAEIIRERFHHSIGDFPAESVDPAEIDRFMEELNNSYNVAYRHAITEMNSSSYFSLLESLENLTSQPPFCSQFWEGSTSLSERQITQAYQEFKTASKVLPKAKLARLIGSAHHEQQIHTVRKKAKHLRYAAEQGRGKRPKRLARAARALQQSLGEFQDSVEARHYLTSLKNRTNNSLNPALYALLSESEHESALQALSSYKEELSTIKHTAKQFFKR